MNNDLISPAPPGGRESIQVLRHVRCKQAEILPVFIYFYFLKKKSKSAGALTGLQPGLGFVVNKQAIKDILC
jgi:hypothetical protein